MNNQLERNFGIVIIESLRDGDKKTGSILFEETIRYKQFSKPELKSHLFKIQTKTEFLAVLSEVYERICKEQLFPILQFEMHGSFDGLQLASGEVVYWDELLNECCKINLLLLNRLILLMSVCEGVSIISCLDPEKRSPFRVVIGTTRKIGEEKLLAGFQAFYNHFLFSYDLLKSVELMNNEIEDENQKFFILTAEKCFNSIIDPDRDPYGFSEMVKHFSVVELKVNPQMKDKSEEEIRIYTEKKLRGILTDLKDNIDYFLMNDLNKL